MQSKLVLTDSHGAWWNANAEPRNDDELAKLVRLLSTPVAVAPCQELTISRSDDGLNSYTTEVRETAHSLVIFSTIKASTKLGLNAVWFIKHCDKSDEPWLYVKVDSQATADVLFEHTLDELEQVPFIGGNIS